MHVGENVDCFGVHHIDDEMRKAPDGMSALNALYAAEQRIAVRSLEHIASALAHLAQKF
jgi:hypothetical protein